MRAFAEQMEIEIGEDAAVAVGIVDLDDLIAGIGDAQAIVGDGQAEAETRPEPPLRRLRWPASPLR